LSLQTAGKGVFTSLPVTCVVLCTLQLDGAEQALFEGVAVRDAACRHGLEADAMIGSGSTWVHCVRMGESKNTSENEPVVRFDPQRCVVSLRFSCAMHHAVSPDLFDDGQIVSCKFNTRYYAMTTATPDGGGACTVCAIRTTRSRLWRRGGGANFGLISPELSGF
jgi:hypothetical protein